jgi:hypothetical protein
MPRSLPRRRSFTDRFLDGFVIGAALAFVWWITLGAPHP